MSWSFIRESLLKNLCKGYADKGFDGVMIISGV